MANNIPTGTNFIKNLVARANKLSDEIHVLNIKEDQLESEIKMYKKQLNDVNNLLSYTSQVESLTEGLGKEVKAVQDFFSIPEGETPDPAQLDLPPAIESLKMILTSSAAVSGRIYQSILNVNVCTVALDDTKTRLLKAMGAPGSTPETASNDDPFGRLSVSVGPQSDLVAKLDKAIKSGLSAMENLSNTYIDLVYFLLKVQELYQECMTLNSEFTQQVRRLGEFEARNENRIKIEKGFQKELESEIRNNEAELTTTTTRLKLLEIDYQMIKAEFDAANQSIRPQKKVSAAAGV
ncbi:MAG: hypothetical protein H6581_15850 [Bacteroidia bacterium]|nr:hypothetical protein [Bacteroidia bacterium]